MAISHILCPFKNALTLQRVFTEPVFQAIMNGIEVISNYRLRFFLA